MTAQAYALFAAPIGHCGIVWSERGLTGLQPLARDEAATPASMGRRFPLCSQGVARTHMPKAICAVVAAPTALKVPYML